MALFIHSVQITLVTYGTTIDRLHRLKSIFCIAQIAAGAWHSLIVDNDLSVHLQNHWGQLGMVQPLTDIQLPKS